MRPSAVQRLGCIEWSVAAQMAPGEAVSGDLHLVTKTRSGALAAVVDGLGHGGEANRAARAAVAVLQEHAGEPVADLVARCHETLRPTRGVVMTVAAFDVRGGTVTTLGIGNVETVLWRAHAAAPARENLLLRAGVIGYQLPALPTSVYPVGSGDLLVLATDGIAGQFAEFVNPAAALAPLVEGILKCHARENDDALVLAVRYLGASRG